MLLLLTVAGFLFVYGSGPMPEYFTTESGPASRNVNGSWIEQRAELYETRGRAVQRACRENKVRVALLLCIRRDIRKRVRGVRIPIPGQFGARYIRNGI